MRLLPFLEVLLPGNKFQDLVLVLENRLPDSVRILLMVVSLLLDSGDVASESHFLPQSSLDEHFHRFLQRVQLERNLLLRPLDTQRHSFLQYLVLYFGIVQGPIPN